MKIWSTAIPEVKIIEQKRYLDSRGYFLEYYNEKQYEKMGLPCSFVQDNYSFSKVSGTLRGLHYQAGSFAQAKLVGCLTGAIFDVAVDIRKESQYFRKWVGVTLSDDNDRRLFIPKGFAHGFCTLVGDTRVFYKVDQHYSPLHDSGVRWDDPDIGVEWPFSNVILSDKDSQLPLLSKAETEF